MEKLKNVHKKVKHIEYYSERKPQNYLTIRIFDNKMCSLLFNLRCKSVNSFRENFHSQFGQKPPCKLCGTKIDSQEHALICNVILKELTLENITLIEGVEYDHIYGDTYQQYNITKLFQSILNIRQRLLEPFEVSRQPAYLGNNTGPD